MKRKNILKNYKIILSATTFFLIGSFFLLLYTTALPDDFNNSFTGTTKIYDRNKELLYEILIPDSGKKTKIAINEMPKSLLEATISVEDKNFFKHHGLDFKAILRAVYLNIKEARIVSGGSTLTQQLARNLLGIKKNRSWKNKIKEAFYALKLELEFSKEEILEMYLNKIYYGNLAYGVEAASLDYFGKHVYDLDLAETAILAGLPQSPSNYNPFLNIDNAKKRQTYVLDMMVKNKYLSKNEAKVAKEEPLVFRKNVHKIKAPHFAHYVINQLEKRYGENLVHFGGLKIYTTLDMNLQRRAEIILEEKLKKLEENNVNNGAILVLDTDSNEVLIWIGSKDYFDESIDGAVDMLLALRQPGSALKPFTYLKAFLKGYTPATTVNDIYTQFSTDGGSYSPKNYDLKFHGLVKLRDSLGSSLNIPAVKVLDYIGIPDFMIFMKKMGISSWKNQPKHYGLSLTLGGAEVKPIELAQAYNVLANFGVKKDLKFIERIIDVNGNVLEKNDEKKGSYILGKTGEQAAYQIIDILSDKKSRILGFGEDTVLELNRKAAVKTGTTRNFKDNFAIGFTPDYLSLVWIGNADAKSMENISGITGAAPIWNSLMEEIHGNIPKKDFARPEGLVDVEICKLSGLLPTQLCSERVNEIFIQGTEPKEWDKMYQKLRIDPIKNILISDTCEVSSDYIEEKVYVVYPPELRRWAMEHNIPQPPIKTCETSNTENLRVVEISNPNNNDSFLIDKEVPINAQKIPLRANVRSDVVKIKWYVNNKFSFGTSEFPFTYLMDIEKFKDNCSLDKQINKIKCSIRARAEAYILEGGESVSNEVNFFLIY